MNKIKSVIIAAILLSATVGVQAQTNVTATPPQFWTTAANYFTSFNTNLASTFATTGAAPYHGSIWTGPALQNNIGIGNDAGVSFEIAKNISAESVTRNLGVLNTIQAQEVGLAYNYVYVDTKLTAGVAGGMRFSPNQGYVAGFAMIEKALTTHTFTGVRVEIQSGGKSDLVPIVDLIAGFTF